MGRTTTQNIDEDSIPKLLTTLQNLKDSLGDVKQRTSGVVEQVKNGGYETLDGLSYLESKHMLLLDYCINLVYIIMRKAEGKSLQDHPVVERLVEARAFLEKIRPIDKQLQYQIERLVNLATKAVEKDAKKAKDAESGSGSDDEDESESDSESGASDSDDEDVFGHKREKKKPKKESAKKAKKEDSDEEEEEDDEDEEDVAGPYGFDADGAASRKAAGGRTMDKDALRFAPRPQALVQRLPTAGRGLPAKGIDDAPSSAEDAAPSGVYRPPMLNPASMEMDENEGRVNGRERRRVREQRAKAGRSDTIRALAAELADAPDEERYAHPGSGATTASQRMRERLTARAAVEEDMFSRVPLNKGELKALRGQRRREMSSAFFADDLGEDVADLVAASGGQRRGGDVDAMFSGGKKRKSKEAFRGKRPGGFKSRR